MGVNDIVLSPAASAFAFARLLLKGLQLFVHCGSRDQGSAVADATLLCATYPLASGKSVKSHK